MEAAIGFRQRAEQQHHYRMRRACPQISAQMLENVEFFQGAGLAQEEGYGILCKLHLSMRVRMGIRKASSFCISICTVRLTKDWNYDERTDGFASAGIES